MEQVITIKGDSQDRVNCRLINKQFYLKNRDVFQIDGKWVREDKTILKEGKRVLKSSVEYVLDRAGNNVLNENFIFIAIDHYNPLLKLYGEYAQMRIMKAVQKDFSHYIKLPQFLHQMFNFKEEKDLYIHPENVRYLVSQASRSGNKVYSCSQSPEWKEEFQFKQFPDKYTSALEHLPFTYGFEIETSNGEIGDMYKEHGMIKLYDGSITGHEYASRIMRAPEIYNLKKFLEILSYTHTTDQSCSVHIHIGNIPWSEENLHALFLLFYRLQDEIHELVYPFKKDLSFLAGKRDRKDHCKYLPKLPNNSLEEIYKYFFDNSRLDMKRAKTDSAKAILEDTAKWNVQSRYYFVNFTNYIFLKNGTLELRLLQGTFNFDRIFNWLLINQLIINYALSHQTKIIESKEKVFLHDILNELSDEKLKSKLSAYVKELKDLNFQARIDGDLMTSSGCFSTQNRDKIKNILSE